MVAFGDSITRGEKDDPGRGGYPARLAALLSTPTLTVTVENQGVGGETTAEGLSRLNSLSGGANDTLIVMEGTNDIFRDISPQSIASNVVSLARRGANRGFGHVVVATIIPIGSTSHEGTAQSSRLVAAEIRQASWAADLDQADPNRTFRDQDDFIATIYDGDHIHPNATGYDILAEHFADHFRDVDKLAPALDFVSPASDAEDVPPTVLLELVLFDAQTGVDMANSKLTINGLAVETDATGDGRRVVLQARPGNLTGRPTMGLDARDLADPPNRRVQDVITFTVSGAAFLAGDIDRDGRVDGNDLIVLARAFGSRSGSSRFVARADLDDNGSIDGSDLALLAADFGLSSF